MGRLITRRQIYIDPHADESSEGDTYLEDHEELRKKLDSLITDEVVVQFIWYYNPLSKHQWTNNLSRVHGAYEYIVLETVESIHVRYWYSIEKTGEGVTIQRSTQFDEVAKLYRRQKRLQGWFWKRVGGLQIKMRGKRDERMEAKQLSRLTSIICANELDRYDEPTDNCHDFARRIWNFLISGCYF